MTSKEIKLITTIVTKQMMKMVPELVESIQENTIKTLSEQYDLVPKGKNVVYEQAKPKNKRAKKSDGRLSQLISSTIQTEGEMPSLSEQPQFSKNPIINQVLAETKLDDFDDGDSRSHVNGNGVPDFLNQDYSELVKRF